MQQIRAAAVWLLVFFCFIILIVAVFRRQRKLDRLHVQVSTKRILGPTLGDMPPDADDFHYHRQFFED